MLPAHIKIKDNGLPDVPGVYFYYDQTGKLLYVGKATSLKKRVTSYFTKAHNARIAQLVANIARIDYITTPTVIEALVLEANKIHELQPPYNILAKDDKSFLYLCLTKEDFPRPIFMRGLDLEKIGIKPFAKTLSSEAKKQFIAVYGPYVSGRSLRTALELIRKAIPWSICGGVLPKPCFDSQIGRCPGVCSGQITKVEYAKVIRRLRQFFEGKKQSIIKEYEQEMKQATRALDFEAAALWRDRLFALEHIADVALITRDDDPLARAESLSGAGALSKARSSNNPVEGINTRIEAYDIAHISGTSTVASMVVFENGQPNKMEYRKFKIKSFSGSDDVRAMDEVIRRRLLRFVKEPKRWPLPVIFVIDGGEGQVNQVYKILEEFSINVPVVGIAKGFDRKQDRLVYNRSDDKLKSLIVENKEILQRARDEAHRFAGAYHRSLRAKRSGLTRPLQKN